MKGRSRKKWERVRGWYKKSIIKKIVRARGWIRNGLLEICIFFLSHFRIFFAKLRMRGKTFLFVRMQQSTKPIRYDLYIEKTT